MHAMLGRRGFGGFRRPLLRGRRSLATKRSLKERLQAQQAEIRAAEERVQAVMARVKDGPTAGGDAVPGGEAFNLREMIQHPAFKYGAASWAVSVAVVFYLFYIRPEPEDVDVLQRDFDAVFHRIKTERQSNGGTLPEDTDLRLWEDQYRELYHRKDFHLSPMRQAKLEGLPGWTWDLDMEIVPGEKGQVVRPKVQALDAEGRRRLQEGDAVQRAIFQVVRVADGLRKQIGD